MKLKSLHLLDDHPKMGSRHTPATQQLNTFMYDQTMDEHNSPKSLQFYLESY